MDWINLTVVLLAVAGFLNSLRMRGIIREMDALDERIRKNGSDINNLSFTVWQERLGKKKVQA